MSLSEPVIDAERAAKERTYQRAYYVANREKKKTAAKAWAAVNPDKVRAGNKARYQANRDERRVDAKAKNAANPQPNRERASAWQQANPERAAARKRAWVEDNRAKARASVAARRTRKLRATPTWVDHEAIRQVYEVAAILGMQVDHIHPLKGKNFCGLHVPWNLQVLTKRDNLSKGNKLLPEHAQ